MGGTELVTGPTRAEGEVPITGLDHIYTNMPTKLSEVRTEWTGLCEQKIIIVRKFSKDFERTDRYTRKQILNNINQEEFRMCVSRMPELAACMASGSHHPPAEHHLSPGLHGSSKDYPEQDVVCSLPDDRHQTATGSWQGCTGHSLEKSGGLEAVQKWEESELSYSE